jgi:hypothetical protein
MRASTNRDGEPWSAAKCSDRSPTTRVRPAVISDQPWDRDMVILDCLPGIGAGRLERVERTLGSNGSGPYFI